MGKTQVSRRSFLTGAGIAAIGAFGAGAGLTGCAPQSASGSTENVSFKYAETVAWDAEYDVVVVGWGGAGSVTAITSADAGAKVLLTEKAPYGDEGGNTRYCEQYALTPKDYDSGVAAMKAFAAGFETATDEIIDFMVKGSLENIEWIKTMGADQFGLPEQKAGGGGDAQVAWPPFEELESWTVEVDGKLTLAGEWGFWPNGEANGGKVLSYQVNAPDNGEKKYWNLMRKNVVDRADAIDVWYESPATALIQDPFNKTVLGVVVERDGKTVNVRAKNGVVLACGSYEASSEMYETFAQWPNALPLGSIYNTGDGIKMGISVGADLWHMDALSGPWITTKYPDVDRGIFNGTMPQRITVEGNCFYVGGNAKRFMKESDWHKHGHVNIGGTWMSQPVPDVMWAIMDDTARNGSGVISVTDESEIVSANTIEELAGKIGLETEALVSTTEEYNGFCEAGEDPRFERAAVSLKPVETAPFHAVRLHPCCVNSQAGPRRNIKCEVLDTEGNPIPQLYSAGELGSFWAGVYWGGGNIAETMYTGREAGRNAAASKEEKEVQLAIVASSPQSLGNDLDESEQEIDVDLGDSEYLGVGKGLHGSIKAKVKVEGGKVVAVEVVEQHETEGVTDAVWSDMPGAIVSAGGTEGVDAVSGATLASDGLLAAVDDAVSQAK